MSTSAGKDGADQLTADLAELLRASHLDLREDAIAELASLIASGKTASSCYTCLSNLSSAGRNPLSQRQ